MTESSDVDKAATAAAKAQDLLDIYNLEKYQADAHGESGSEYDGIAVTSSRHVFFSHERPTNMASSIEWGARRGEETSLWRALMWELSVHHLCRSFSDYDFVNKRHVYEAGFTVVGDPVNVEAAIALFKWQKIRLEAAIHREWPRFQARQSSHGRGDGGLKAFFRSILPGAVTVIANNMWDRRRRNGREADIAALSAIHGAVIAEYMRPYLLPPPPPPGPTEEDYNLVELMGREIGEKLGQEPLQDS